MVASGPWLGWTRSPSHADRSSPFLSASIDLHCVKLHGLNLDDDNAEVQHPLGGRGRLNIDLNAGSNFERASQRRFVDIINGHRGFVISHSTTTINASGYLSFAAHLLDIRIRSAVGCCARTNSRQNILRSIDIDCRAAERRKSIIDSN